MKKQPIIRTLMLALIIMAGLFVVTAVRSERKMEASQEECLQEEQECPETNTQSEFLLESLTRNLLGR